MFHSVEVKQFVAASAVVQGLGHNHLRVQQCVLADLPHQHTEVAISAVEHRRHTEAVGSGVGSSHGSIRTAYDAAI